MGRDTGDEDISLAFMPFGRVQCVRCMVCAALIVNAVVLTACGGSGRILAREYEYEEQLYPALDGSAILNVSSSVAALVALRGVDLDINPRARLDRNKVRALFQAPGVEVRSVSTSRRNGRRFVHLRVETEDVRRLAGVAPLAWSRYQLDRQPDQLQYRQDIGAPTRKPVGDVGWTGEEVVGFRLHLPSRIQFHNAPGEIERGNILTWEQPLTDRLKGTPLDLQVRMDTDSIFARTLVLFTSTIIAAGFTLALAVWWISRRGRAAEMAESRP